MVRLSLGFELRLGLSFGVVLRLLFFWCLCRGRGWDLSWDGVYV